ncbi:hypothetical protein VP01_6g10 [Puccinia sorghi]|uniref:Protein OS-9 homolog n=1 Tax=Puccinia sorghi TaxID=27349 RepID=A0A0L6UDV7_9BASI|nr:hypothetical protein VP01_6g10 [Puccinia sorghi]
MKTNQLLLTLLCLSKQALSLSSHSPPDPLAYPKYSINQDEPLRHTLMRTASGQAFLCALPPIPLSSPSNKSAGNSKTAIPDLPSSETDDLERKSQREKIEQEGLKNGLKLISSLKDRCIYTRLGWFTYSFCYGKGEIKQFHAIMVPGYTQPQEDPNQDVYILGFHLDHPQNPHHQARLEGTLPAPSVSAGEGELTSLGRNRFASGGASVLGSISDVLRDESVIKTSMEIEEEEFQQKRYLVQRWDGGSICDMTGKPRSVEVQFHCSTLGSDHIALLRETSICEYLLVIHTPRLCSEPLFLDGGARKGLGAGDMVSNIGCRPVLTSEEIEKWTSSEKARRVKEEQEKLDQEPHTLDEPSKAMTPEGTSSSNKDPDSPEATVEKDESSNSLGEPKAFTDAASSIPDQTILSEAAKDGKRDEPDSEAASGKSSKSTTEKLDHKLEELEIDPITVYFDADTGKIYMDKSKADEARRGTPGTTDGKSPPPSATTAEHKGNKKTSSSTEQANSRTAGQGGEELEEIAKALKDSLGALLRDLRGDEDGRRPTPARGRPKSMADLIASLSGKSPKLANLNNKHNKQTAQSPLTNDQVSKLASENHSNLVKFYQQTFNPNDDTPGHAAPKPDHDQTGKDEDE